MELPMRLQMRKSIWLSLRQSLTGLLLKKRLLASKLSETFSSLRAVLVRSMRLYAHRLEAASLLSWAKSLSGIKHLGITPEDILIVLILISGMSLWLLSVSILFMRVQSTLQGFGNLDI